MDADEKYLIYHIEPHFSVKEGWCVCGCDECGRWYCWCLDCSCDKPGEHEPNKFKFDELGKEG